jgi:hypothetical protein
MSGTSSSGSPSNPVFDIFKKDGIVNSASDSIRGLYESSYNNNTLFIGLFAVIVFTVLIAYLLYTYLGSQLFAKIKSVVSDTKVPVIGTKSNKFNADLAKNANGSRKSFSFWIYINDINKYSGQYKSVCAVSSDGEKAYIIENCSPFIFLDKSNNSMFIRFTKLDDKEYNKKFDKNINGIKNLHAFLRTGISIDYIPLQRWVHIAIVCNSNTFKTTLYAYVDGELAKTISDGDSFKLPGYGNDYNDSANDDTALTKLNTKYEKNLATLNNINLNMTGYLYVGNNRDFSTGVGPGFSGLLSSFTTFNYELNQQDIYNIYNDGPVTGFLAKIGLGSYGVRSPVYKL